MLGMNDCLCVIRMAADYLSSMQWHKKANDISDLRSIVRDWSLITGRGGGYKTGGGGGHIKFYPCIKAGGGGRKGFSHARGGGGGGITSCAVVFTQWLDVLAILKEGEKKVSFFF